MLCAVLAIEFWTELCSNLLYVESWLWDVFATLVHILSWAPVEAMNRDKLVRSNGGILFSFQIGLWSGNTS